MIESFFDDPRHRESEERAFFAEHTERAGDLTHALVDFAKAAALEEANALDVPGTQARVRTLLGISAVSLWLRAERWEDAARAGCALLARPDELTPDGRRELRLLVDRAWRYDEIKLAFGEGTAYATLEARLSGGLVATGIAPHLVVAERRDVLAPLLFRAGELKENRTFRKAGPSALAATIAVYEAPAIAASYGLRLYVVARNPQQAIESTAVTPRGIVEAFLEIASAAAEGPERLATVVPNPQYAKAFLRGFRDLAPDGVTVGEVSFSTLARGRPVIRATLAPQQRINLTRSLAIVTGEKPVAVEGVLKAINLRGKRPSIAIEAEPQVAHFRLRKGEHDDTIGPKLNRHVRVVGTEKKHADGEVEHWASDVLVIEDTASGPGDGLLK
jgi:hypothetical protein